MKRHISYPSINAFRHVVEAITKRATYIGKNDEGWPLYDETIRKPIVRFVGTVKLHGTNAGVSYNTVDGFWAQSRENIINVEKDNAGFAYFADSRKETFITLIKCVAEKYRINLTEYTVSLYGEWAGRGIQKGVAVSSLDKAFYIFGVKVSPTAPQLDEVSGAPLEVAYWVDHSGLNAVSESIYNVKDFKTYTIDIDFNKPSDSLEALNAWTLEVEEECPISKSFQVSGIGEGIVFTGEFDGERFIFKSKGEKHSVVRAKEANSVDVERVESLKEFAEYAVTSARVEQAIKAVFGEEPVDIKSMGQVIKWVNLDVLKEEADTLKANGFDSKEISGPITANTREIFKSILDKAVMG